MTSKAARYWGVFLATLIGFLILHFGSLFLAGISTQIWGISRSFDPIGVISETFEFNKNWAQGCPWNRTLTDYPFGTQGIVDLQRFLSFSVALYTGLSGLFSEYLFTYNATILLLFFLNGVISFWALHRLTGSYVAAFVAAFSITFSAYAYAHSYAHINLTCLFFFPMFLLFYYELQRTPGWKPALLTAVVFAAALYLSPYYAYFNCWIILAVAGVCFWRARKNSTQLLQLLKWNVVAGVASVVLSLPFFWMHYVQPQDLGWFPTMSAGSYGEDLRPLYAFSARPWHYLIPNVHSLFLGDLAVGITQAMHTDPWSDEFAVSLGLLSELFLVVLGAAAVLYPLRRRLGLERFFAGWSEQLAYWSENRPGLLPILFLIGCFSFLLSLAPTLWIGGLELPTPNQFFRHWVPFRSYSRFGILVLMMVSLAMGMAVSRSQWRVPMLALILAMIFIENFPRPRLYSALDSELVQFLRARPETVIYRSELNNPFDRVRLEGTLTGKKVMNGFINFKLGYLDNVRNVKEWSPDWMRQLGGQLFLVTGPKPTEAPSPVLELLGYFPRSRTQVWKFKDSGAAPFMTELLRRRSEDPCWVVPKETVRETLMHLSPVYQRRGKTDKAKAIDPKAS